MIQPCCSLRLAHLTIFNLPLFPIFFILLMALFFFNFRYLLVCFHFLYFFNLLKSWILLLNSLISYFDFIHLLFIFADFFLNTPSIYKYNLILYHFNFQILLILSIFLYNSDWKCLLILNTSLIFANRWSIPTIIF